MTWWGLLLAASAAALLDFGLPVIVLLIVMYLAWQVFQAVRRRREFHRKRAVVAAAVDEAWAEQDRREARRAAREAITVRLVPRPRRGER